jgi:hypothetical protein
MGFERTVHASTRSFIHAVYTLSLSAVRSYPLRRAPLYMKLTTVVLLLLTFSWVCHRAYAEPTADIPEDYAYLRRMHVPDVVVNCVAAFDNWVRTTPRYDLFVISERRALQAKITSGKEVVRESAESPIDTVVKTPAFAKIRGKYQWVPVKATCSVWHGHVVGLTARPAPIQ